MQGNANNPGFNAVFNSLNVGVLILDSEGYFMDVNNSYCRLIGYERKELVGKHFLTVVPELQKDFVVRSFNEDMSSNASRTLTEFPIQRKDGHIFAANCNVTVIVERST